MGKKTTIEDIKASYDELVRNGWLPTHVWVGTEEEREAFSKEYIE